MKFKELLLIVILISVLGCNTDYNRVPLIKTEQFFKNPDRLSYQISPDGNYISYLANVNGKMNIFIQKINEREGKAITNSTIRDIRNYFWVNNSKIIYGLDLAGNDNYQLYLVDIKSKQTIHFAGDVNSNIYVLNSTPDSNGNILIADNKEQKQVYDVYLLNINTKEQKQVLKNNGKITWFLPKGNNIKIVSSTDGVNTGYFYRLNENEPFKMFLVTGYEDDFKPIGFTDNENEIYALSNINRDKVALIKYNIKERKETGEVYQNSFVDIKDVLFIGYSKKLMGVSFTNLYPTVIYLDKKFSEISQKVKNKLENENFTFESNDLKEDKFIVKTYSDKSMGEYFLYVNSSNKLIKLAQINSELNTEYLASMKPISFIARDGRRIEGYLSLPANTKPTNLPVIVMPHGGPWLRDEWGYNSSVQFLCNRGYAVLQVNYRGSTGYGKEFVLAGFREWGGKIQDDIADGTKWLIEQGIADPDRIGIYGFSFGGYSALISIIKYPELYKCAASYCGILDLRAFVNSVPAGWEPFKEMMYKMVGHPIKDSLMLKNSSPYDLADRLKGNVLIAQGAHDPKIKISETEKAVAKLKSNKNEVTYIVYNDEGHGFINENNRIDFFKKLEAFFAKNLGGRKE
jgi:dipeptidyl aminopeptidase/acylaminoacyl peptidase